MTVEPHPYPERALWRVGPPVAAAALAAVGFVVMLIAAPGSVRTAALVVVLLAQVALMAGRGIALRRSGRTADGSVYCHQFFFAWSFFAGGTDLLGRDDTTVGTVFSVVSGLLFAALLTSAFLAMNRAPKRRARRDPGAG